MNETPYRPQGRSTLLVLAIIAGVIAIPFFMMPKHSAGPAAASGDKSSAGKIVMIDFYTDWCGYCKKMDAEVYPQPDVKKALQSFEFRKVNAESSHANRALAQKYNIQGFPTVVFVDAHGVEVHRIEGYEPAPQFAAELTAVSAKAR